MSRAQRLRWFWLFPAAFLATQAAFPRAVLAGSAAFDNSGRIPCDQKGLIAAPWRASPDLPAPAELQPGAMATVPAVCPAERYFPTGVLLTPGATYQIDSQGLWRDGWNRLHWQPFFQLGGAIGPSEQHLFSIGRGRRWTAPTTLPPDADRQLYLFANDWPGMLHNNRSVPDEDGGPLRVTISRLN